jgi:hypothetical protein
MFEDYQKKVLGILEADAALLKSLTWSKFVLHFWSTTMFVLGVMMSCVNKLKDVAAEFEAVPYEEKKKVVVDWINANVNIPGPTEEQEGMLLGILFDMAVNWFEANTGIMVWNPGTATGLKMVDGTTTPIETDDAWLDDHFLPYSYYLDKVAKMSA